MSKKTVGEIMPDVGYKIENADKSKEPSESFKILAGQVPMPAEAITVSEASLEQLYSNYEKTRAILRVVGQSGDKFTVSSYAPDFDECIVFSVPKQYPITVDLSCLSKDARERGAKLLIKEMKKMPKTATKSWPAKTTKTAKTLEPKEWNGTKVFIATLGEKRVFMNAEDGTVVKELSEITTKFKEYASSLGYKLVSRSAMTAEAVKAHAKAYSEARKPSQN